MRYANSSAGAITLNINSTGAKAIYINGTASGSSNYTLPAGTYLAFYDGTNFYFRTDGKLTASITGTAAYATNAGSATYATNAGTATKDGAGQEIKTTYIKNVSTASDSKVVTFTKGGGSTFSININRATKADTATYATNSGTATYSTSAGSATTAAYIKNSTSTNSLLDDCLLDFGDEGYTK